MIELSALPIDQFAQGWVQLAFLAASALANRQKNKADRKAADEVNTQNLEYEQKVYDQRQEQFYAQLAAEQAKAAADMGAENALLNARREGFNLTKEAGDSESDQEAKFAEALTQFGLTSKEAQLEAAKQKRRASTQGAAKNAKVKGTGGRSGRLSGAFRTGANKAVKAGLSEAAHTAGQLGAMQGYDEDMRREGGIYGDLSQEGRRVGDTAERKRNLAGYRETLGQQEAQARRAEGAAAYSLASMRAKQLGMVEPQQGGVVKPDYGIWDTVGDIAKIGSAAYSIKGGNPLAKSGTYSSQLGNVYDNPIYPQATSRYAPYAGSRAYPNGGF